MRVLMFGWEFPPHISGGLGTASYGLTKALSKLPDIDIIFVVPRLFGDEDKGVAHLVGASDIPVSLKRQSPHFEYEQASIKHISELKQPVSTQDLLTIDEYFKNITYIAVDSPLIPYLTPENFRQYLQTLNIDHRNVRLTKYGEILILEENEIKTLKLKSLTHETEEFLTKFNFSGSYGPNLLEEVRNYAIVGGEIARRYEFDVIHAHDWLTYLAGIEAKKITGKPLVIHVHATEFDRSGENVNTVVYNIEKYGMEMADKIITVSNWTKNIVVKRYGIPAEKVVTVYNAVEPVPRKVAYKKTVPEKIVTFLGRITFQKGPEYFVEAASLVLSKTRDVRFVMAGSGDMFYRMIRYAASLKIMDKFHFTNFLRGEEVVRMFDISDVYVMPSISEPFGISPLEALRSNVPVIISKQSGVSEVLQHALKVDFWDTHAIADNIYGLVKYDGLAQMFKKYAQQEVQRLKWETSAKKVREVYLSVVKA